MWLRTRATFACRCVALVAFVSCKPAERPRPPAVASQTIAVSHSAASLRGVASDGVHLYSAFSPNAATADTSDAAAPAASTIEARRGNEIAWQVPLQGNAGDVAVVGTQLAVALSAKGTLALGPALTMRGDPGALLVALDRTTGKLRWRLPFDSTQWTLINAIATVGDDILVAGAFGGTLRVGSRVVSSAGGSDGFVARVTPGGTLTWLVRLGGTSADAVQGIAATSSRIAIAGTFSPGAELQGHPLTSIEERLPYGDAFVATLDADGKRRWTATFGSRADDAVAGVAVDRSGRIVVAASVRDTVQIGGASHITQGPSDGLVAWYSDGGELTSSVLIGSGDFDGIRAIAALGDHVVVAGFFSGSLKLADRTLAAGGGDDSFLAALDANGTVATAWHVGGAGREEVTSVSSIAGGFIAGVAHTGAASIEGATVPAPADPASGAALVVRGF